MGIRGVGLREFQAVVESGSIGTHDDGELLARFLHRDTSAEMAFTALVDRHSKMVIRVCQEVLGDRHEAQDAAQATFFILAQKAASIRRPEKLPCWLHGVARNIASRVLRKSIRRKRLERKSVEGKPSVALPAEEVGRGWPEVHEELAKLSGRDREAIILCDLTGMTHEQAAERLGCPARTLETRLYRGRERLKRRLSRRGYGQSGTLEHPPLALNAMLAITPSWIAYTAATAIDLTRPGWFASVGKSINSARLARAYITELAMTKVKLMLLSGVLLGLTWRQLAADHPVAPVGTTLRNEAEANDDAGSDVPAPPKLADAKNYTQPITVSGHALGPDGRTISGARIFLASRRADYKRLAETTTDIKGHYEFRAVPLPIERSSTVTGEDYGAFQVFGQAEGLGFAWRPAKSFYPKPRPSNITYVPDQSDPPARYRQADAIQLDLKFPVAARLTGTVVDDEGRPIPKVRLEIRDSEPLKPLDGNVVGGWHFDSLNERDSAPASMKVRVTDDRGRFDFEGMPAECRFRIDIRAEGYPSRRLYAATTNIPQANHDGGPVLNGDMKVGLAPSMDIPIQMLFADSMKPAASVAVQAVSGNVSDLWSTDVQGRTTLRLPRGKYHMENWPAAGTPYLVTEAELEVVGEPPTEPIIRTLRPAATLEVTVVDEATGEGLKDVDL